jgi:hypothetical protein
MAARIAVPAEPDAAWLCGLPERPAEPDLTVVLGHVAEGPSAPWVLWREGGSPDSAWERPPERILGQGDEPLWRRAPWPAADRLFELELPRTPLVAVAVEDERRRAGLVERLDGGADTVACERLTAEALRQASVVIMAADPPSLFPARAFAVLAARRVLVIDRMPAAFGLLPGRDHVQVGGDDDASQAALSVVRHPESFHWMRTLGALAAERQRASRVYPRLAADLALEGRAR